LNRLSPSLRGIAHSGSEWYRKVFLSFSFNRLQDINTLISVKGFYFDMQEFWTFISDPSNQKTLTLIGGGLTVLICGSWAFFKHFSNRPTTNPVPQTITANQGGMAAQNITATAEAGGTTIISTGDVTLNAQLPPKFLEELRKILDANKEGNKDKVMNRLLRTLDEKEVALEDRESQLRILAEEYTEIEARLANRDETDTFAKKAKERLDEGDLEGAEKLLHQSLEQNLQAFKARKKAAAADAFELAKLSELKLDYQGALLYYEQAVELAPENRIYLNELGLLLQTMGEYDKAIGFYNQALTIDLKTLGPEHPNVATEYNNLGSAWDSKGEYDKAIALYNKALRIDLKTLGPEHPNVATRYNNLGSAWKAKAEYDKAIDFYNKALSIDLKTFGSEHPHVATRYNNLGLAWDSKGEYDEAIGFYNKAFSILLKTLGPEHPNVARIYNNLGLAWKAKGEYDTAIEFYNKALSIDLKTVGPEHPSVTTKYNNLGSAWDSKGEYDTAIGFYNKALTIGLKTFGPEHPNIARIYSNLGGAWTAKGEYNKAIDFFNKALSILELRLGKNHPNTKVVRKNIEELGRRRGGEGKHG